MAAKHIEYHHKFRSCARTVPVETAMDCQEALSRLDRIEDTLLAQIRELRAIRTEMQRQADNGTLEALLSPEQVAEILGVDIGHVHAQARSGKLPSIMVGKYRKFSPSQLKKWIDRKNSA